MFSFFAGQKRRKAISKSGRAEMFFAGWLKRLSFLDFQDSGGSPEIYRLLRKRMIVLMLVVTVVPLFSMAMINLHQYRKTLREEIVKPQLVLVNKSKHSIELFLAERLSAVSFVEFRAFF